MSFQKSMKGSNRRTSAKVKGQRVPDCTRTKSKRTFTMFRFNERYTKFVLRDRIFEGQVRGMLTF